MEGFPTSGDSERAARGHNATAAVVGDVVVGGDVVVVCLRGCVFVCFVVLAVATYSSCHC